MEVNIFQDTQMHRPVPCGERVSTANSLLRMTLGSQAVLCGYVFPASRRWLIGDELEAHAFSADSLCVADGLPVLCGHLAASSLALDLLTEAGWKLPERLLVFRDTEGLMALILGEASQGRRVVTNFPLPEASIPAEAHLVNPRLRAMLNDKGSLEILVPEHQHPVRRRVEAAKLLREPATCRGAVLKIAATESGGGHGVLLPPDSADPVLVSALLHDAETAILEEFLPLTSTRCFNYLIDGEGGVRFLGAPEQFLMDSRYLGNWFRASDSPDPAAVAAGAAICRRAAALGYRGAAGFDAGFLRDGSFRFVDLNFRMNGSTAPLLLVADLLRRCGAPAALRSGFRGRTSPGVLSSSLRRLISEARFFPLAVILSDVDAAETNFLVYGFLTGPDQAGILASAAEVTRRLLGR
jgi:hypothetical protein